MNGAGKTTFIGKLSERFRNEGKRVLLAAGDTFRAGAIDQLRVWAERTGADFIGASAGADPAAVAFQAIDAAVTRGIDVVIVDTAGRLHTSASLMEELKKVARVIARRMPGAPHESLLVLDGTIGQNAVQQAREFSAAVPITGLVVTKLDGTARGGVVVAVHEAIDVPVKFLGVGEHAADLEPFDAAAFSGDCSQSVTFRLGRRHRARHRASPRPGNRHVRGSSSRPRSTFSRASAPRAPRRFRRIGVITAGDLLFHIPHRYEDASTVAPIASLETGMNATVIGRVISKGVMPTRKGLRIFQAVLRDSSGMIEAAWPGQPYLDRTISKGDTLLVVGTVRFYHGRQLQPREFINLGDDEAGTESGRVLSVYPATEGLSFKVIRAIIDSHLDPLLALVDEYLPQDVLARAAVPSIRDALRMVHRPQSLAEAARGRARLAFEELFFVHILHQRARTLARVARRGIRFENKRDLTSRLRQSLPYELTDAQVRASREIFADMCSDRRMHRLLQGDVGSGKTIVALFAALLAMENGYQAALMAPTELLAEQHARTFRGLLAPLGIEPMLVTGSQGAAERKSAAARLESTEPAVVVGTHALVQQATSFGRLGLAIVDEQHRFGVEQRKALGAKGEAPDVLLMSATPIPRSLALTLYGDLDLSTLDERPVGRKPVVTALRPGSGRDRVLAFLNSQLDDGRQAYIVYPVIAESEKTDLKAATTMYETLSTGALMGRRVALLHGKIPAADRDAIMREFRDGAIQVLVATTVVEVGIDVPNATVMIVEHPERFGLSQLHQLRGRVGRGAAESFCILLGDVSPDAKERIDLFVRTDDGFEIARADLRLRGMGDLFGERQSGVPTFRVADPLRDEELNASARTAAEDLLSRDPELRERDHAALRRVLNARYQRSLELFRVG